MINLIGNHQHVIFNETLKLNKNVYIITHFQYFI